MASYHFRIKSDKKSDGSRVSASVHVDYISRQGKYKNEGTDLYTESNLISFAGNKNFGEFITQKKVCKSTVNIHRLL